MEKHLYGKTGRAGSIPASGIYERLVACYEIIF